MDSNSKIPKDFSKLNDLYKLKFIDEIIKKDPNSNWALAQLKKIESKYKKSHPKKDLSKLSDTEKLEFLNKILTKNPNAKWALSELDNIDKKYNKKKSATSTQNIYCKFCGEKIKKGS